MATVTTRRPSAKPRKSDLTVSLALAIDHVCYSVTPIRAEDPDVSCAWRLEKKGGDGAVYDVATTIHGHQCTCPDWETRRNGLDARGCKHVRACVVMGLLEDTAPVAKGVITNDAPALEPTPSDNLPWWEQSRECDVCGRIAKGCADRADGVRICRECSQKQADEAELQSFLSTPAPTVISSEGRPLDVEPAPCCPPDEPTACQPCRTEAKGLSQIKTLAPATDPATSILDRGIALAKALAAAPDVAIGRHDDSDLDTAGDDGASLTPPGEVEPSDNEGLISIQTPDDESAEASDADIEPYNPTPEDERAAAEVFTAMDCQAFLDRSGTMPLANALDHIGNAFRGWANPFGKMLAGVLDDLAQKAFMTGAETPAELLTGIESLEREARDQWERVGRESVAKSVYDIDNPAARRGRPEPKHACGSQPFHRPTV